jgi:hypothetical protein
MQKVESSSLFIRSHESPGNRGFCLPSDDRAHLLRHGQKLSSANLCPFDRPVVLAAMRRREPVTPLRRLRVHPQREPRILVAQLVSRVADVVAAGAAEARVRPA